MMNTKRSSRINLTRYAFMVPALIILLLVFSISKADIAKPIRIKLIYSAPVLAKIMNIHEGEVITAKPAIAKAKKAIKKAAIVKSIQKADTVKKAVNINNNIKDSVIYYIDGVRSAPEKVDPNDIVSISVLKGVSAQPYIDKNDSKSVGVIKVITKNSSEGMNILSKANVVTKVSGNSQVTTTTVNTNVSTNSSAINQVNVQPKINITHNITGVHPKAVIVDTNKRKVTQVSVVTSDGKKMETLGVSNDDKGLNITNSTGTKPLILVDDKETSDADLKKIDPKTIETMNVIKTADATQIQKYGDKAKNGIIIIKTKKQKD